jgi:hypothetical protein
VAFHPLRCELIRSGSMLWFEQGVVWWEGSALHGLWLVLLESAKNRFLEVDPSPRLEKHVPAHVWYGTTCSLIRIASGSVPYSMVRRRVHGVLVNRMVQEGPLWGNLSKAGYTTWSKPL